MSADPYEPEGDASFVGDDGLERIMDGTVKGPNTIDKGLWKKKAKTQADEYTYTISVSEKLLEKLITRRLTRHFENNIHNSRQYGFRPHRGTESAIALAHEEIALGLAYKYQINIILLDISKASNKVWHDGLKYKLIQLQLPIHLTRLLCSFLGHRTGTTRLGTHLGTPLHLRKRAIQNINPSDNHQQIQTHPHRMQKLTTHPYTQRQHLRFHLTNTRFITHIKQRITQAQTTLTRLRLFSCCTPRTKIRLYKTVRLILEYTAIPLVAISNSQKYKKQSVQNKALLWARPHDI
ncbi:uncharacterized protein LOC134773927 [Penaeus indicus]|uniref:uncharacterized protein LOC134773927 n=1 Tax=Penaeus indicus TaxID=29960 RepID=UPI00300C518F